MTRIVALTFLGISSTTVAASLFESHDILEVRIEAPLTTLADVRSDAEYLDGYISYVDSTGELHSFDLKLRARGRYRLLKKTCDFPPIRLNFRTGQVEDSIFDGQDKLKLITHCQNKSARYEQLVLREYLAYRILQTLTDKSFGARLLRVTYINSEGDNEAIEKYGFVIEDGDDIGKRTGMSALEIRRLKFGDLDEKHSNLINLFQYLIGNTDYSLVRGARDDHCCHNSVPFSDGNVVSLVPYDFDFSGLVNAPYADPNPKLGIDNVRTRLYRGRCDNNEHLIETIALILPKKPDIYALVDNLPDLHRKHRLEILRYLNMFFRDISDEKRVRRKLIRECS